MEDRPMGTGLIASIIVVIGSGIGGLGRYWVGVYAARMFGEGFPIGTLFINVGGSFIIGLYGALTMAGGVAPASAEMRTFVMVGLCGGYTTFSSFSLQTFDLIKSGEVGRAALYIILSVLLCVIGTAVGYYIGGNATVRS
jgi:CrcB protein